MAEACFGPVQYKMAVPKLLGAGSHVAHTVHLARAAFLSILHCFENTLPLPDKMTRREPVNIRRLLRENEQYAASSQYAQDVQRGDAVSSWHEHQSRKSSRPEQMPPGNLQSVDLKVVSCSPKDRMQRKCVAICDTTALLVCHWLAFTWMHSLQACGRVIFAQQSCLDG